jgi:DNA helicase-2/ATP-dependent DNA helicase PcrA
LNLDEFVEQRTPYSTQHGVKGAEFDDVFVIIDDAAWNQ